MTNPFKKEQPQSKLKKQSVYKPPKPKNPFVKEQPQSKYKPPSSSSKKSKSKKSKSSSSSKNPFVKEQPQSKLPPQQSVAPSIPPLQVSSNYQEVRRGGKLVGYRDLKRQQTISVSEKIRREFADTKRKSRARSSRTSRRTITTETGEKLTINPKTGRPYGTYTKAPEPKGLEEKLEKYRGKVLSRVQLRAIRGVETEKQFMDAVVVLGGLGAIRGLISLKNAILKPKQTVLSTIQAIRHPVRTIQAMGEEFYIDPVGTIAQYYTYSKALNLGTKAIKRSPVGRYVQEEMFIRSQPKDVRAPVRAIIKSSKVQEKLNPYKIRTIKKVDFLEVKSLTRAEAKALSKTLAETDTVVFGSVASRTLSKKLTPLPKDVDLATANVRTFNQKFVSNLPAKVRKNYVVGSKIYRRISSKSKASDPKGVITKGGKIYDPILDVKSLNRIFPGRNLLNSKKGFLPVSGYVYDIKGKIAKKFGIRQKKPRLVSGKLEIPTQKVQKVGKIRLTGFGEQTTRKGLGTIEVLLKKNIRRAKDPQSFVRGLEVQVRALKKAKPKTKIGKIINKGKIKKLNNALKILKSKSFSRLLESKVKGLTKDYPILKKIDVKKLKKIKKVSTIKPKPKIIPKTKPKPKARPRRIKRIKVSKKPKSVKRTRPHKRKSLNVKKTRKSSKVPSRRPSKLPSRLPPRKPSKVPPRRPSKVPPRRPSKVPPRRPSKVPPRRPSKVPPRRPSKTPSRPPSRIPPSRPPSRIPPSRPPSRIPPSRPPAKPPKKPPKIPIKISRRTKLKRGQSFVVDGRIKVGTKRKIKKLRTTFYRGFLAMQKLVDRAIARSFDLIIIGVTRTKDIKKPASLAKFRMRFGKDPRVLTYVEKTRFAIDTKSEKRALKASRSLRKSKNAIRSKNKLRSKTNNKRSNKKRKKAKTKKKARTTKKASKSKVSKRKRS